MNDLQTKMAVAEMMQAARQASTDWLRLMNAHAWAQADRPLNNAEMTAQATRNLVQVVLAHLFERCEAVAREVNNG